MNLFIQDIIRNIQQSFYWQISADNEIKGGDLAAASRHLTLAAEYMAKANIADIHRYYLDKEQNETCPDLAAIIERARADAQAEFDKEQ